MLGADEKLLFSTDTNVIKHSSEPRTWRFFRVATKECEPAQLGQGERAASLVLRITLHHALPARAREAGSTPVLPCDIMNY
jgi:hypothetical protein